MRVTGVNLVGNLHSEKGVGEAARSLARAAHAVGLSLALDNFVDTGAANIDRLLGPPREHLQGDRPFSHTLLAVNPDTLSQYRTQAKPNLRVGRRTYGYWFWELPKFPAEWADCFGDVDEVLTGSSFAQQAIARSSPVPVTVLPPALDPNPPRGAVNRATLKLEPGQFVILYAFDAASYLARKNPAAAARAFRVAFPTNSDVRLIFKASRFAQCQDGRQEFLDACQGDSRIMLLDGLLSRPDMTALLDCCDCYLSPHRAEGFGLTLAEAMLLQKPVIATGWSGTADFLTPFTGLPVDYRLVPLQTNHGPYTAGQVWAAPDISDMVEKLRWVYANRTAAARLGERGRAEVLALCHPRVVGERLLERLSVGGV